MEAVRTFIIQNEKYFFGIGIVAIAVLSLAILVLEYHAGGMLWLLAGMAMLSVSLMLKNRESAANEEMKCAETRTGRGYSTAASLLLGIAIYCFPATAAVVPFFLSEAMRRKTVVQQGVFILLGTYFMGIPQTVQHGNALWPIYRLISWLNVDNVFDHNLSFWSLVTGREQLRFGMVAVVLTAGILVIGLFWYLEQEKKETLEKTEDLAIPNFAEESFLLWSVWSCLLFLPYGHAEDGSVLFLVLVTACRNLLKHRLYQAILFLQGTETLFMLGSAYGGYERFGYDFYQIAVGLNVLAWLIHSYRMMHVWKGKSIR